MSEEEGFQGVAEQARQEIYAAGQQMRQAAEPYDAAVHAVVLGVLAGACDLWASIAISSVTRARFIEAMRQSVEDFAAQAYDNHKAGSLQ